MKIIIETIPHSEQRYETVGDWFTDEEGDLRIKVSDLGNKKHEILIAIHELIESLLCEDRYITDELVTEFDKDFEIKRGLNDFSEPGDDPKSPYRNEHCLATGIEMIMASNLNVSWKEYEQSIHAL